MWNSCDLREGSCDMREEMLHNMLIPSDDKDERTHTKM